MINYINLIDCVSVGYVLKGTMTNSGGSVVKLSQSSPTKSLTLTIAVAQNNLTTIHDLLIERSTPGSSKYQQWLTLDKIGFITRNQAAHSAVTVWLRLNGVNIVSSTPRLEYITANASIQTWSRMFATTFYTWKDNRPDLAGIIHNLAESYHVPISLNAHITSVLGVCNVPPVILHHAKRKAHDKKWEAQTILTTVSQINSLYGISSNIGQTIFIIRKSLFFKFMS